MFKKIEKLDPEKHRNLRLRLVHDYGFAAGAVFAPLSVTEIIDASRHYPISFTFEEPLLPMAMLSLKSQSNAFVDENGKWLAPYVPAHIRRYPFILGSTDDPGRFIMMADMDSPHLGTGEGEPLYANDGGQAPVLDKAVEFLTLFHKELAATEQLLKPLAEKGVLAAKTMEISRRDGETVKVDNVRAIDHEKLMALDDQTLASWVRSGLMGVIYIHASSLKNLAHLDELQRLRAEKTAKQMADGPFQPVAADSY